MVYFADCIFIMDSAADGLVYFLRVPRNILRIFFVNNSQDTILLTINYGQPMVDTINIPVGNSNLCLCSNSHIGKARKNTSYGGLSLHTQNSHMQMSLNNGRGSDFALHITLSNSRQLPTLLQLSKQFIREHGSQKCNKTRFQLLKQKLPRTLAESICEDYKELRTNQFLQLEDSSKLYFCKCSKFWYAP
jgi:hypothetical protein